MALDPLSIAHLGFAYKPLVAAMLGLWDEIVEAIAEMQRGGGHVVIGPSVPHATPHRHDSRKRRFPAREEARRTARRMADEEILLAVL
jgi:hypothetical protein